MKLIFYFLIFIFSGCPASLSYHFEKSSTMQNHHNPQQQHHMGNHHHHPQNQVAQPQAQHQQHSLQLTFQNLTVSHNERQILSDVSGFVR